MDLFLLTNLLLILLLLYTPILALSDGPVYKPLSIVKDLNCARVIANDASYIKEKAKTRIVLDEEEERFQQLPIDCASIKARHYFSQKAASVDELNFPIAFARTVFRDYLFIETELAANYAPQNLYCYALDAKVGEQFRKRMRSLASCFPNVFVNDKEFSMDSQGHNQTGSLLECMNRLTKPKYKWRYLITLQNHDVQLKTNQELVQIFRWMRGANDVEICNIPEGRVNASMDWTFGGLNLFKNKSCSFDQHGRPQELKFAKGYLQSSLSREFVNFVINELDVSHVLTQLETGACFVDEIFFQTLSATDALNAPGAFTHSCLDRGFTSAYVTRFGVWLANNTRCYSKYARHFVCIFGLEDLAHNFKYSHSLFANKMLPTFDFGAINCWHEEMYNRTHIHRGISRLDSDVYLELPQVRYQMQKKSPKAVPKMDCQYKIPVKEKLKMYDGQTDGKRKITRKAEFRNILNFNISGCHLPEK